MKTIILSLLSLFLAYSSFAQISESVYVESTTDSDSDGQLDRIYVTVSRPSVTKKLSTIFTISPYSTGGNNDAENHNVDYDILPQDQHFESFFRGESFKRNVSVPMVDVEAVQYAKVDAHSVGTGKSTGCPTVGDKVEIEGAKAVIDWLNGRARAFYANGTEAKADWANGKVGMTGVSYNGTLPIMVASTGVEGLKAIVPVSAISNWYDYYRANGLVVNPGGYIGEDADVLGYFIVRRGTCKNEMEWITQNQGRENGDFTPFWQERNHLAKAKNIKAATFIIHGQNDWNVKQKHAIQLWEALEGVVPRRMFLHRGGHGNTSAFNVPTKIANWFAYFLEGVDNGITSGPQVEVEMPDGTLIQQNEWPHEKSQKTTLFFGANSSLGIDSASEEKIRIVDNGSNQRLQGLISNPTEKNSSRLIYLTGAFATEKLLSGTTKVHLNLSVLNRRAANITVALVEYDKNGAAKIITRGWADPQNFASIEQGKLLVPGEFYQVNFDLEPKQYKIQAGSKLAVVLTATDYDYTLRPKAGTEIEFKLDKNSYVELRY